MMGERRIFTANLIWTTIVATSLFILQLTCFGLLLWALIKHADGNASDTAACSSRITGDGFSGNPDFYGFGIRLGIYLQWWASLIANLWLPDERRDMLAAYLVFSTALIIAVLLITFQHACTFTAEVVVILFIYWGGYFGLLYSMEGVVAADPKKKTPTYNDIGVGLSFALPAPTWLGITFSVWFWLRLATAGEVDFAQTPGGTFFFLFGHISSHNKPALRFIVVFCFIFAAKLVFDTITMSGLHVLGCYMSIHRFLIRGTEIPPGWHKPPEAPKATKEGRRESGILCALILIYSTIAIELTLAWNSISGVYSVSSTGQVIPLIIGVGLIINVIWKLEPWKVLGLSKTDEEDVESQVASGENGPSKTEDGKATVVQVLQQGDGTWQ